MCVWVYSLQAAFIFLNLCLAAWATLGDEFGQMLTLGLHAHSLIVTTIIHPLGHMTAASWIVSLVIVSPKKKTDYIHVYTGKCDIVDNALFLLHSCKST